jgi:hypothetical protein
MNFIVDLSNDKLKWQEMSENALQTSTLFRRDNADKFVDMYLKNNQ